MTAGNLRRFELLRALMLAILVVHCSPALAATQSELVTNGLLSQGRGGQPVGWRYEAYSSRPDAVQFVWQVYASGLGVLKIVNTKLNDSRWIQSVAVSPSTWYHVSGWVRSENAGPAVGARLTVADNGCSSTDLRGTSDWQLVHFWMKTRPDQKSADLECQLGGASALSTGVAYCTAISVSEGKPPQWASDEQIFPPPRGIVALLLSVILATGVILLAWRFVLPAGSRA